MKLRTSLPLSLLCTGCILLLTACFAGNKPATLYTLQPQGPSRPATIQSTIDGLIMVMPVRLAPQLQNRGLMLRSSASSAKASASHLWAGPLDQQIGETVTANLKAMLATDNVATYPGPRYGTTRYQLELEISVFSGDEHSFQLQATYTLSDVSAKRMVLRKSFNKQLETATPDIGGFVDAASRAVSDLSQEAAMALMAQHLNQPHPDSHDH